MSSATSSAWNSGTAGRERRVALALGLGRLAPVEVVAAARDAPRRSPAPSARPTRTPRPGRDHQRLLRAGDDDVDAPLVLLELGRAEAGDGVDGEQRAVLVDDLGDRLDVVDDARRGLAQRGEHDLDAVVLGQQAVELGRVEALAPARLVARPGRPRRRSLSSIQRSPNLPAAATPAPWCPGGRGSRRRSPSRPSRWPRTSARRWTSGRPSAACRGRARRAPRTRVRGGRASASAIAWETAGGTGVGPGGHEVLLDVRIRRHGSGFLTVGESDVAEGSSR